MKGLCAWLGNVPCEDKYFTMLCMFELGKCKEVALVFLIGHAVYHSDLYVANFHMYSDT